MIRLAKRLRDLAVILYSEVVFFFKKRGGFLDLCDTCAVGRIVALEHAEDGDTCFDLQVEPAYEVLLRWKGWGTGKTLHCEVMPRERIQDLVLAARLASLRAGDVVRVEGRWAFDGSHSSAYPRDGLTLKEIWGCIVGRSPNLAEGWTEIHPITRIDVIVRAG